MSQFLYFFLNCDFKSHNPDFLPSGFTSCNFDLLLRILSLHRSILFCRTASSNLAILFSGLSLNKIKKVIATFYLTIQIFLNSFSDCQKLPIMKRKKNSEIKHCSYLFNFLVEGSFHRIKNRLFNSECQKG